MLYAEVERERRLEIPDDSSRTVNQKREVEQESVTCEASDDNAVSCIVRRLGEGLNILTSRLTESKFLSIQTDSIRALFKIADVGTTIGELMQRIDRFPAVSNQKLRVLKLGKLCDRKTRSPH